jgi:hypothetical protein
MVGVALKNDLKIEELGKLHERHGQLMFSPKDSKANKSKLIERVTLSNRYS